MMDIASVRGLRAASREVVRELGFLQSRWEPADVPHVQVHILVELGDRGTLCASDLVGLLRADKSVVSKHLKQMRSNGWIEPSQGASDQRQRPWQLTAAGRLVTDKIHAEADAQVSGALNLLSDDNRAAVLKGMAAYGKALSRLRKQGLYLIREIEPRDDAQVASLIRAVMPEFGASGPGFALHDPEVSAMSSTYIGGKARYFVIEERETGKIVGGAGFAPLAGGDTQTCELRKMYFLSQIRGLGLGKVLLAQTLEAAKTAGYRRCYLETLERMAQARRLYEEFGFKALCAPEGTTGHFGCDRWYARAL